MVQLQDAVTLQILRDEPTAHFLVNIQVEDQPDGLGLFLVDDQLPVDKVVAIGCKATVPFALASLLDASLHGLHADVLTLNFRYCGEHGNHQFARILGGVDAVLYTDQINPKILHGLQGRKDIGGVASKA